MHNINLQPDQPVRNFTVTVIVAVVLLGLIAEFAITLRYRHTPAVVKRTGTYCAKNLATACVDLRTGHYFIPQSDDALQAIEALLDLSNQLPEDSYDGFVVVDGDIFIGRRTQELNGRFSFSEALDQMLQGSGLERDEHDRGITIKPTEQNRTEQNSR